MKLAASLSSAIAKRHIRPPAAPASKTSRMIRRGAPRVTTPLLMLNGAQDFAFPVETSQKPMFRHFGTRELDKKLVIYEGGHVFPFARIIKDTLDWLDKYLGVPKF